MSVKVHHRHLSPFLLLRGGLETFSETTVFFLLDDWSLLVFIYSTLHEHTGTNGVSVSVSSSGKCVWFCHVPAAGRLLYYNIIKTALFVYNMPTWQHVDLLLFSLPVNQSVDFSLNSFFRTSIKVERSISVNRRNFSWIKLTDLKMRHVVLLGEKLLIYIFNHLY